MAILGFVLSARDIVLETASVGDLYDELVVIRVGLEP